MESVVGVFKTSAEAVQAVDDLRSAGIPDEHLTVLMPDASEKEVNDVPTTETEGGPGVGAAIGGVVGGVLGAASGLSLWTAAATLLVPGVGPVIAVGLLGAALLGAGGAVGGAVLGEKLDDSLIEGLPTDDLYVYEDALRHGRSVVIAFAQEGRQSDAVRKILAESGAEDIDAARENWWLGLRDTEEEHYKAAGRRFAEDEPNYRRGFEAALLRHTRDKSYDEALADLKTRYPTIYSEESFRNGYERGKAHGNRLKKSFEQSA